MTENEAIAEITSWTRILMRPENQYTSETAEAQDMAIKALKEIQQYRSIGTVAECREAMGRNTKIPLRNVGGIIPVCGKCGGIIDLWQGELNYCPNCGQAIE